MNLLVSVMPSSLYLDPAATSLLLSAFTLVVLLIIVVPIAIFSRSKKKAKKKVKKSRFGKIRITIEKFN